VNPAQRLESVCASVVERAFALAFPSALEPVQVARKLVAAFESAGTPGRGGRRFLVRVGRSDFARFQPDRAYLEPQWSGMLARLAERSRQPQRAPEVVLVERPGLPRGTVEIEVEYLSAPLHLTLRVRKGIPLDACLALRGALVVGRDATCDLRLVDPRVSRRHIEIDAGPDRVVFRDLGSANGVELNHERRASGALDCGDVLRLGDSELVVEADET
jgi:Inner membrane component of T3SS, cytoplasmic domain/Protein of unknown function (DUF3662)